MSGGLGILVRMVILLLIGSLFAAVAFPVFQEISFRVRYGWVVYQNPEVWAGQLLMAVVDETELIAQSAKNAGWTADEIAAEVELVQVDLNSIVAFAQFKKITDAVATDYKKEMKAFLEAYSQLDLAARQEVWTWYFKHTTPEYFPFVWLLFVDPEGGITGPFFDEFSKEVAGMPAHLNQLLLPHQIFVFHLGYAPLGKCAKRAGFLANSYQFHCLQN